MCGTPGFSIAEHTGNQYNSCLQLEATPKYGCLQGSHICRPLSLAPSWFVQNAFISPNSQKMPNYIEGSKHRKMEKHSLQKRLNSFFWGHVMYHFKLEEKNVPIWWSGFVQLTDWRINDLFNQNNDGRRGHQGQDGVRNASLGRAKSDQEEILHGTTVIDAEGPIHVA